MVEDGKRRSEGRGERRGTGIGMLKDARRDRHEHASPEEEEVATERELG